MSDVNAKACDTVGLRVGGELDATVARSALTLFDKSMLAAMFNGRHKLDTDSDGKVFIDRDPKYFSYVLDYLRNGGNMPVALPEDEVERQRVWAEFDYFMVPVAQWHSTGLTRMIADGSYTAVPLTSELGPRLESVYSVVLGDRWMAMSNSYIDPILDTLQYSIEVWFRAVLVCVS